MYSIEEFIIAVCCCVEDEGLVSLNTLFVLINTLSVNPKNG